MKYSNVLFDIDNTLINSADLIASLLKKGADHEGVHVPLEEYRQRIGRPGQQILSEFGVQNWQHVLDRYTVEFDKSVNELTYFTGIEQMLNALLTMNIKVGVVTSKDRVQFDKEIGQFPIIANMSIVTTADLTENPKPSGDPIAYTLARFRLVREQTLYVGDSIFDMQAAKNAVVDFAVAAWGALPDDVFKDAKYRAETPNDIIKIIQ